MRKQVKIIVTFILPLVLQIGMANSASARRAREIPGIIVGHSPIVINGFTSVVYTNAVNSAGKEMGKAQLIFEAYPRARGIARMNLKVEAPFYGQGAGDALFVEVMEQARKEGTRYVIFDFPCPYCVDPEYMVNFLQRQEGRGEIKNTIYIPSDVFVPNVTPPHRYAIFEVVYPDSGPEGLPIYDVAEVSETASSQDIVTHLRSGQPIGTFNKRIPQDKARIIGELPSDKLTNSAGFITASRKPIDMLEFAEFMTDLNYIRTTSPNREAGDIVVCRDAKGKVSFAGLFIDGEWIRGLWLDKLVVECREEFLPSDWTAGKVTYYRRIR